ncbi:MAG: winged helix-turn-helix domain-containing protein [Planctomycetia bacterium]|nr:winged helix-turn-helix domain-containing protein [Planctomycetia bacterium]
MSTVVESSVARIGETAGAIWRLLDENGPLPLTKLLKECDEPRDVVMQALGWLAREDKIQMDDDSRNKTISLK